VTGTRAPRPPSAPRHDHPAAEQDAAALDLIVELTGKIDRARREAEGCRRARAAWMSTIEGRVATATLADAAGLTVEEANAEILRHRRTP
jgi:hypothetical protein